MKQIFRKSAPAFFIVLTAFFLLSGEASSNEEKEPPAVLWSDRVAIFSVPENRHPIPDPLMNRNVHPLFSKKGMAYYQVPASLAKLWKSQDYKHIISPPFEWIDPSIHDHRKQTMLKNYWRGYKDVILTERILKEFAVRFPEYAFLTTIGHSRLGKPIYALRISDNPGMDEDEPSFLFDGAHHGNEPLTMDYVLSFGLLLLSATKEHTREFTSWHPDPHLLELSNDLRDELMSYIRNYEIWLVPMVNPDGVEIFWDKAAWSGRKNARDAGRNSHEGVDINRNYPFYWNSGIRYASSSNHRDIFYRGPSPGSEVETRNMMEFAERERFVLSLSYHTWATRVLVPYTADGAMTPYPSSIWRIGKRLAAAGTSHRPHKPYRAHRNLYAVDGTDQDWLFHTYGTAAYIVEGSYHSPEYEPNGRLSVEGMLTLSLEALKIYHDGPVLRIHVKNEAGHPLKAGIYFPDFVFLENETRTTHPENGRYDYFLYGEGEIVVGAGRDGYASEEKTIRCDDPICDVKFTLKKLPD